MNVPKVLPLDEKYIQVIEIDGLKDDDGEELNGLWCPDSDEIYVNRNLNDKEKLESIFHEYGHAIFDHSGVNDTVIPKGIEEMLVDRVGRKFIQLFRYLNNSKVCPKCICQSTLNHKGCQYELHL